MGSGPSWSQRRVSWRIKEAAKKAQVHADALACEAWNERMRRLGGPVQPSPSLSAAINGGFPFLRSHAMRVVRMHGWT